AGPPAKRKQAGGEMYAGLAAITMRGLFACYQLGKPPMMMSHSRQGSRQLSLGADAAGSPFLRVMLVLALLTGGAAGAERWPEFRGPNGTGVSDATGLPLRWSEQENIR